MNFLAHLWLADRAGADLAGAVLGDLARGSDLSAYPPELERSIRLHRRIDALTDAHPLVCAARTRFAPGARRYAGIVLDVLFDHALARRWEAHTGEPLEAFAQRAGAAMAAASAWFERAGGAPVRAGAFAALLLSYRDAAGIDAALARIARRLSQPQRLLDAAGNWQAHRAAVEEALAPLLADLRRADS